MNKKIQLFFAMVVVFGFMIICTEIPPKKIQPETTDIVSTIMTDSNIEVLKQETINGVPSVLVPHDTAKSMQSNGYYGRSDQNMLQAGNTQRIWVAERDFYDYLYSTQVREQGIPWSGERGKFGAFKIGKSLDESEKEWIAVPSSIASQIQQNQLAKDKLTRIEFYGNNQVQVLKDDYNTYYYNQLPWYKRWAKNISNFFTQKPSEPGSGALKGFASVPMTQLRTQPTRFSTYFSKITLPKTITPSQKTKERAKKISTETYKSSGVQPLPSASKALEQAERFGIGYQ